MNISLRKETVKIAETYQNMIMSAAGKGDYEMYLAVQKANKYKVSALTGLSEDEINDLEPQEYSDLMKKCGVIMNTSEAFNKTDSEYEEKKNC